MSDASLFPKAVILLELSRAGSFRAAAARLALATSTVSEHVQTLEDALGVRLLSRTSRKVTLTEEGRRLLAFVERGLDEWSEGCRLMREANVQPSGLLRVTYPGYLGEPFVTPIVAAMVARYPAVEVHLLSEDRTLDLIDHRIDVAIRTGPLADSAIVARRIGADREVLVAAPMLAGRCRSGDVESLADAPWCGHTLFSSQPRQLTAGDRVWCSTRAIGRSPPRAKPSCSSPSTGSGSA